jgi:hypothetical protein
MATVSTRHRAKVACFLKKARDWCAPIVAVRMSRQRLESWIAEATPDDADAIVRWPSPSVVQLAE